MTALLEYIESAFTYQGYGRYNTARPISDKVIVLEEECLFRSFYSSVQDETGLKHSRKHERSVIFLNLSVHKATTLDLNLPQSNFFRHAYTVNSIVKLVLG